MAFSTEISKLKLIILSDLWGKEKSNWVNNYIYLLEKKFDIKYYDCCELGKINRTDYSENNLHEQFLNGGIENAVKKLIENENSEIYVLAFSIGGVICWKASLAGLKVKGFYAISSTRLRKESEKPNVIIELFYGEKDEFKPENSWFENIGIEKQLIKNEMHNFYQNKKFAIEICESILTKFIK